jgi:hypothetical protein
MVADEVSLHALLDTVFVERSPLGTEENLVKIINRLNPQANYQLFNAIANDFFSRQWTRKWKWARASHAARAAGQPPPAKRVSLPRRFLGSCARALGFVLGLPD